MENIKLNYVVFAGALILMACGLTACSNTATNEGSATNVQTNAS